MSTTALKIIAFVFMVVDHIGQLPPNMSIWPHQIGRLSFPIFIFCSAQGLSHTRSKKKYITRFYLADVFMELAKRVAFYSSHAIPGFSSPAGVIGNNIFRPLFCLSILYFLIDHSRQEDGSFQKYLLRHDVWQTGAYLLLILLSMVVPITTGSTILIKFLPTLLGSIFYSEDGWVYLLLGVILYWVKDDRKRLVRVYTAFRVVLFLLLFTQFVPHCLVQLIEIFCLPDLYSLFYKLCLGAVGIPPAHTPDPAVILFKYYSWMMPGVLPFLISYDGQRGKGWKYFFYIFYPSHILALYYTDGILGGAG